jgi:maleate cis-trans isomerase
MILYRCGVIVPWVNTAVEKALRDLPKRILYAVGRLAPLSLPKDSHDESYLKSMLHNAEDASGQFGWLPLDHIYLACTSISYSSLVIKRNGFLMKTSFECLVEELQYQNHSNINLSAPYSDNLLESLCKAFKIRGINVLRARPLTYLGDICDLDWRDVVRQCHDADLLTNNQPLVLACTAIETKQLISKLAKTGINCITSNSALLNTIKRNALLKQNTFPK